MAYGRYEQFVILVHGRAHPADASRAVAAGRTTSPASRSVPTWVDSATPISCSDAQPSSSPSRIVSTSSSAR